MKEIREIWELPVFPSFPSFPLDPLNTHDCLFLPLMSSQIHPYDYRETPDLRIVPLDLLIDHEYIAAQRTAPLAQRLQAEGLLKNPPIVAPLDLDGGDERFVVLDGANRTTALHTLGYPHVLVQVVDYETPFVTLS